MCVYVYFVIINFYKLFLMSLYWFWITLRTSNKRNTFSFISCEKESKAIRRYNIVKLFPQTLIAAFQSARKLQNFSQYQFENIFLIFFLIFEKKIGFVTSWETALSRVLQFFIFCWRKIIEIVILRYCSRYLS